MRSLEIHVRYEMQLHWKKINEPQDFQFFFTLSDNSSHGIFQVLMSPIIVAYLCSAMDIASIYQPWVESSTLKGYFL